MLFGSHCNTNKFLILNFHNKQDAGRWGDSGDVKIMFALEVATRAGMPKTSQLKEHFDIVKLQ